jgi:hypothetical protein
MELISTLGTIYMVFCSLEIDLYLVVYTREDMHTVF